MTYKMCPIRKGQKRENFVNLLILILEDVSNRKLYTRSNLQVLSCCGCQKFQKRYLMIEIHKSNSKNQWALRWIWQQALRSGLFRI